MFKIFLSLPLTLWLMINQGYASYGDVVWEYNRAQKENRRIYGEAYSLSHHDFLSYLNMEMERVLSEGNMLRAAKVAKHMVAHMATGAPFHLGDRPSTLAELSQSMESIFWVARVTELTRGQNDFYARLQNLIRDSFADNNIIKETITTFQSTHLIFATLAAKEVINLNAQSSWGQLPLTIKTFLAGVKRASEQLNNREIPRSIDQLVLNNDITLKKAVTDMSLVNEDTMIKVLNKVRKIYVSKQQPTNYPGGYYRDVTNDVRYLMEQTSGDGYCFFNAASQERAYQGYNCGNYADAIENAQGEDREEAKRIISRIILNKLKLTPPEQIRHDHDFWQRRQLASRHEEYGKAQIFKHYLRPIQSVDDIITLEMITNAKKSILAPLRAIEDREDRIAKDDKWGIGEHEVIKKIFEYFRAHPDVQDINHVIQHFRQPGVLSADINDVVVRDFYTRVSSYFIRRLQNRRLQNPNQVIDAIDQETGPRLADDLAALLQQLFAVEAQASRPDYVLGPNGVDLLEVEEFFSCYNLDALNATNDARNLVRRDYDNLQAAYNQRRDALEASMKRQAIIILDQQFRHPAGQDRFPVGAQYLSRTIDDDLLRVGIHPGQEESFLSAVARFELALLKEQDPPGQFNLSGLFIRFNHKNTVVFYNQLNEQDQIIHRSIVDPTYSYRFIHLSNGHFTRLKPLDENGRVLLSDLQ